MAAPSQSQAHSLQVQVGGWSTGGRDEHRNLESASASHGRAAASLLHQVEVRWQLRRKGKHTPCRCRWLVGAPAAETSTAPLSPPPPRTEEQPQACFIRWSFDGGSVANAITHTHLQDMVPGWSAGGHRRAPTLSPPPPRTEEQPQACSIRCSFDVGSLKRQSHTHTCRCLVRVPAGTDEHAP